MMSSLWHRSELSGGEETRLSVIRPCEIEVLLIEALDTNKSLHLTICYLLKVNIGDLES